VCIRDTTGSVQCWGNNDSSQVDAVGEDPRPPVEITLTQVIEQLAAGTGHTCARTQQGQVWCWGANASGQLGDGTLVGRGAPGQVEGLADVVDLDAGETHTCAVTSDGQVWCWGSNLDQELGQTDVDHSPIPVRVASLPPVDQIALGAHHSCARSGTSIDCWGRNDFLQLGAEIEGSTAIPQRVVDDATTLVAGSDFNCVARDGVTYCWGHGNRGQLGHGQEGGEWNQLSVPSQVLDLPSATPVAAGYDHSCAVDEGGALYCWGGGLLGDGEEFSRNRAVRVAGIERASPAVSAGDRFTCAIADGALWCWGNNENKPMFSSDALTVLSPVPVPVECH
jgi:alpha-tubulin suppressor-like RCC1 family protein